LCRNAKLRGSRTWRVTERICCASFTLRFTPTVTITRSSRCLSLEDLRVALQLAEKLFLSSAVSLTGSSRTPTLCHFDAERRGILFVHSCVCCPNTLCTQSSSVSQIPPPRSA